MKNKSLLLLIILLSTGSLYSQNKRDYIWLFGSSYKPSLGIVKGNILDFNNKGRIDTIDFYDSVAKHNAEISDKQGNLLFYYNGCRVIDSTMNLMEGGDSINYGKTWRGYCGNWARYPGPQNSIILPDPGNSNGYYIIHKRQELQYYPILRVLIPELLYTYVDMTGNGGRGKVIVKNKRIFKTTNIVSGYLTACKHANGRDWWIVQMEQDTNIYFKILLTPDTIMVVDSVSMGRNFDINSGVGQAVFTPDGTKWITNDTHERSAMIYDFDRETGELSNLRWVMPQDSGIFYRVAVSPNSRFAYLSNMWDLFQVDLWADDIPASLVHIAHIDYFIDRLGWTKFGQAQLAPDCKIYIVSPGTNNYLHVINKPNLKGKACDFRQHSVYLPQLNFNNSIPNFPHFRIDEEEVCDSTITSIFGDYVYYRRDLEVYPNPSSGIFNIRIPDGIRESNMVVSDIQGHILKSYKISGILPEKRINIDNLPTGRYNIEIYPVKNPKRIFYGTQVVKVE